jgi:colanic acid biosynthesis glycosyl transferase WcaI
MGRRFLFINQFYPPDPAPTGRLLHEVAAELVARGHYVRVLCSRKEYGTGRDLGPSASLDGVDVRRVFATPLDARRVLGRMVDDGLFLLHAGLDAVVRSSRVDLVLAASSPPLIGLVAAVANRCRGLAHAHWTMDVYPDALEAYGWIKRGSWHSRVMKAIARFQFKRSALILTLGPFMADRVATHLRHRDSLEAVPLWSDLVGDAGTLKAAEQIRQGRGWREKDLVLLYAGNMGRGHRFGEFLEAARALGPDGPVWAFVGGGPRRGEVEEYRQRHPSARIQLLPYVDAEGTAASLLSGDVHLVSLAAEWQALIVPSKLQAAFSLGRPVIFVGPTANEIATWVRESGGGWVVAEGDITALIEAVQEARQPEERARRGRAALDFGRRHFDAKANRARVADLLEACASQATDTSGGRQ